MACGWPDARLDKAVLLLFCSDPPTAWCASMPPTLERGETAQNTIDDFNLAQWEGPILSREEREEDRHIDTNNNFGLSIQLASARLGSSLLFLERREPVTAAGTYI